MPRTWRNHDRRVRQRVLLWVAVGGGAVIVFAFLLLLSD